MDAGAEQDNNVVEIATRYGAEVVHDRGDCTVTVERDRLHNFLFVLQQNSSTRFDQLIDLCGVDYLEYGREGDQPWKGPRYAVVYHLLSVSRNERLRVVTWLEVAWLEVDGDELEVDGDGDGDDGATDSDVVAWDLMVRLPLGFLERIAAAARRPHA